MIIEVVLQKYNFCDSIQNMDTSVTALSGEVSYWVSQYGYFALLFLFILEGPVTGIISGVLISLGSLSFFPVFFLYISGSLIRDSVLFYIFRKGNYEIQQIKIAQWVTSKFNSFLSKANDSWREKFRENYFYLMFFSRIAPINLVSQFVVIMAGIARVSTRNFYMPILIAQPIWSAAIIATGFYFGNIITNPEKMLFESSVIFAVIIGLFLLYRHYMHEWIKSSLLGSIFTGNDQ